MDRKRILVAVCLAGIAAMLLLVGAERGNFLRRLIQTIPVVLALFATAEHRGWGALAAIPVFIFWLGMAVFVWLPVTSLDALFTRSYSEPIVILAVVVGLLAVVGIATCAGIGGKADENEPAPNATAGALVVVAVGALQVGAMLLSLLFTLVYETANSNPPRTLYSDESHLEARNDEEGVTAGRRVRQRAGNEHFTQVVEGGTILATEPLVARGEEAGNRSGEPAARASASLSVVQSPPGGPVRVGGDIRRPTKVRDVQPEYPRLALQRRVQGTVILETVIGTTGGVTEVRVLRSMPLLNEAAVEAVEQWEYTPTLLNGEPVPVVMTVTVDFRLP